jgi:hypothetical protein
MKGGFFDVTFDDMFDHSSASIGSWGADMAAFRASRYA